MTRPIIWMVFGLALSAGFAVANDAAAFGAIPPDMRGVWAKRGHCGVAKDRLTITAHTAGWGEGPFKAVSADVEPGEGPAVSWDEEYVVDNFVRGPRRDVLIHNGEGFHMPAGEEVYVRCGARRRRVP